MPPTSESPPPPPPPEIEPRRLPVAEAYALAEAGRALLLDARDRRMYDNAHPKGALSLAATLIEAGPGLPEGLPPHPDPGLLLFYCA